MAGALLTDYRTDEAIKMCTDATARGCISRRFFGKCFFMRRQPSSRVLSWVLLVRSQRLLVYGCNIPMCGILAGSSRASELPDDSVFDEVCFPPFLNFLKAVLVVLEGPFSSSYPIVVVLAVFGSKYVLHQRYRLSLKSCKGDITSQICTRVNLSQWNKLKHMFLDLELRFVFTNVLQRDD